LNLCYDDDDGGVCYDDEPYDDVGTLLG